MRQHSALLLLLLMQVTLMRATCHQQQLPPVTQPTLGRSSQQCAGCLCPNPLGHHRPWHAASLHPPPHLATRHRLLRAVRAAPYHVPTPTACLSVPSPLRSVPLGLLE
jgi:hypothetical protein